MKAVCPNTTRCAHKTDTQGRVQVVNGCCRDCGRALTRAARKPRCSAYRGDLDYNGGYVE